jgi:N-acetylneuraminic acid mutarotase
MMCIYIFSQLPGLPPVSSTINVQPGLLSSIQIMDANKVIITAPVNIAVNGTFQFDAVGYDMSGNVSPINPTFTITGGIGTINTAALFTAAATAPLSGTLTADIGGLSDMVNINIQTIPSVVATTPADASKDNMTNTTFSVTFSEAMDTTTLNGNTGTTCAGSIQVSSDNFITCIAMTSATPVFSAGNTVATLTPAASLTTNTYKVRVTTAAKSVNTIAMAGVYTSVTGASVSGWAWMSGSSTVNAVGVYGTKGIASATNVPGARYGSISWSDASGNLYLFGGYGYGSTATLGYLNDLWKYDNNPASATYGQWTWISGSNTINAIGVYGTKGAAAAINVPGARCGSISWSDASGNLYLFGGYGYGSTAMAGSLNDLWKYDNNPASATYGQWTWISGSNTINVAGVYGTKNTAAVTNIPGARYVSISWSDVSGNLYLFGGYNGTGDINDLWKYDNNPTSSTYGQWTWISGSNTINAVGVYGTKGTAAATNVPGARHYSISWSDSFGNLYLFGGSGGGHFNDLWKYDNNPASATYGQWTWISGTSTSMVNGIYGTKGKASPTNMPGARYASISWGDTSGDLYLFGGSGYDSACNLCSLNDLWKYDNNPASATYGQWAWISGSSSSTYVGVYGTKNVPSTTNKPGPRSLPISWSDASGNLYLFGGNGYGSTAVFGSLNDLWKYQP